MCGFVCRFAPLGGDAARVGDLPKAMALLSHRGPDASGRHESSTAGSRADMGALRLRIIDLRPESDMPMITADGSAVLVYNGELYNADVLRSELLDSGHTFVGDSDTECVLHLYEEHRSAPEELLPRLRGMFSFVVWDQTNERVFAARDRLGIKPLLYSHRGGELIIASEARALAGSGMVPSALNTDAARGFLRWGVVSGEQTIVNGVRRLSPGKYLTFEDSKLAIGTWWTAPQSAEPSLTDERSAIRLVRSVLIDSITRHLVSDRPTGLFLSAGTDSRVIATLAASHGSVSAFTLSFPNDPELDETSDAARVAAELGLHHVVVPVSETDLEEQLLSFISSLDSPSMDALNSWFICRAAAQSGLVVALSGLGADELVGTYPSFHQVPRVQQLSRALHVLPPRVRLAIARRVATNRKGSRLARLLEAGDGAEQAYMAVRSVFSSADFAPGVLPSAFAVTSEPRQRATPDTVTRLEFDHFLAQQLLPDTDSVSMAHSLEVRVPFLDHKVVEAVLAVPYGTRANLGKQLLLEAAGVAAAPKKRPFALPMDRWLRGPLSALLENALLSDELPFSDLIPRSDRQDLHAQFLDGRLHWSRPWSVAVLRLWPGVNGIVE